jgi:hypothetical protein
MFMEGEFKAVLHSMLKFGCLVIIGFVSMLAIMGAYYNDTH